jgi:uncharacterized membrane protein
VKPTYQKRVTIQKGFNDHQQDHHPNYQAMYELIKFSHLAAGIIWMGGMALMIWALRPVAIAQLEPAQRLPLLGGVLSRFFKMVAACVLVLLASGGIMLMGVDMALAPKGWHVMIGLGSLMCLIFGHLFFGPFSKMKAALSAGDLGAAAPQLAKIHPLVLLNFYLGWLAIGAVVIWR